MIKTLQERPFSYFESENVKGKNRTSIWSEWVPYNLSVIKQWIDMRDKYTFTDNEEDIYGGDWEQLDIREYHSKYGTNYIYIDNDRMLWRIRKTGDEFYNGTPYRRPRLTKEQVKKTLEELYKEQHELQEKLYHCEGSIVDFEDRLKEFESDENEE